MSYLYHMFTSYYAKGGLLMWPIFLVSVVAWFMAVEKLAFLRKFHRARRTFLDRVQTLRSAGSRPAGNQEITGNAAYDALLRELSRRSGAQDKPCSFTLLFREFLISAIPELERGLGTLKVWISVAPLLGLLGTVIGMIRTFRIITDFGFGNPSLMAEGISMALVTPQAGLTVAFPLMMFQSYLSSRSRTISARLLMDGEELVKELGSRKELQALRENRR